MPCPAPEFLHHKNTLFTGGEGITLFSKFPPWRTRYILLAATSVQLPKQ
jgi:hypothetical protein